MGMGKTFKAHVPVPVRLGTEILSVPLWDAIDFHAGVLEFLDSDFEVLNDVVSTAVGHINTWKAQLGGITITFRRGDEEDLRLVLENLFDV